MNKLNFPLVSLFFLLLPGLASAATVNGTLGVTAEVGAGCQVNASNVVGGSVVFGDLNFGSINTLNAQNIDGQTAGAGNGSIEMECSDGTQFTIALDNGLYFDGATRAMANGADPSELLNYALYQDAARTVPWTSASPLTGTASGISQVYPIYGRIPGGQAGVASGSYSDTVQVTISW
ncbi:MAG: spore coat U domain-containing protein [Cellvibrionaceae bacterium]|nr:spore coat U domain-containing protein [Cellvibrionaceae bacterium]